MTDLLPIGRFAQITQLTIKALHLYEALDLLRPAHTDPQTGYRYFTITQLPLARRIRLLRSIDMPLDSIRTALQAPTPERLHAALLEQQLRIEERMFRDRAALQLLRQMMDRPADVLASMVQVKAIAPQLVASIRFQTTPEAEQRRIPSLLALLERFATQHQVRHSERSPLRLSHAYSDQWIDTEIAVPITRAVSATEEISIHELPASTVAYLTHLGPREELWAVYWSLLAWIQQQGFMPADAPMEAYLSGPSGQSRTEVRWPFERVDTSQPVLPGAERAGP